MWKNQKPFLSFWEGGCSLGCPKFSSYLTFYASHLNIRVVGFGWFFFTHPLRLVYIYVSATRTSITIRVRISIKLCHIITYAPDLLACTARVVMAIFIEKKNGYAGQYVSCRSLPYIRIIWWMSRLPHAIWERTHCFRGAFLSAVAIYKYKGLVFCFLIDRNIFVLQFFRFICGGILKLVSFQYDD